MAARRIGRLASVFAVGLLALVGFGCVQDDGSRFNPLRPSGEVGPDAERELGFRFDRAIQDRLPFVDDVAVLEFVDELGQELVRGIEPQPFLYRFRLIQDPTLNAFAVPGGYVYLHSGTVLAAGSVDELAGVVAHEIAHIKARHTVRLQERAAIPDLLTSIAAIGVSLATQDARAGVTVQAANEALKLRFSREFEAEADRFGAIFMVRAGHDPQGMVRFFQRLMVEKERSPARIPPYLYSHPQVEDRIAAVSTLAETMRPVRPPPERFSPALLRAQARLAYLVDQGRSRRSLAASFERSRTDPLLAEAKELAAQGDTTAALERLAEAERLEPNDPRLPFHRGEWLEKQGRWREAMPAYHRTLELDPSRALVFLRLGLLHKRAGDRARAAFYFEQASRRAARDAGPLHERAEWELAKTIFPVFADAGLGRELGETIGSDGWDAALASAERIVWWARLDAHFATLPLKLRIRWLDPSGRVAKEGDPKRNDRLHLSSRLSLDRAREQPGLWAVEAHLDDDRIDRRLFWIRP